MKAIIQLQANLKIEIEDDQEMQVLHKSIVLANPPKYCNLCKNNQFFRLESNKDKEGNIYINQVCLKCYSKAKLGQYKSKGYFWREFAKYDKNAK